MSDRTLMGFVPSPPTRSGGQNAGLRPGWSGRRRSGPAPGPVPSWHASVRAMLRAAWRRHQTRRYLSSLDPYLLKDIGITYADAEAELNKPFWMA